jgi:hypothetical protein
LILILCGVFATSAQAAPSQQDYLTFAEQQWPGSPCNGQETVEWVPPGTFAGDRIGEADVDCHIRVQTGLGVYTTCRIFVHELGHYHDSTTADPTHSDNPASIMFPSMVPYQPCADGFAAQIAEEKVHAPCRAIAVKEFACGKGRRVQMFGGIAIPETVVARTARSRTHRSAQAPRQF